MRMFVERFYAWLFLDEDIPKEIPYSNKLFMFWFSIIAFLIVLVLIGKDIAENISDNL